MREKARKKELECDAFTRYLVVLLLFSSSKAGRDVIIVSKKNRDIMMHD
jgi:hypothetical protein